MSEKEDKFDLILTILEQIQEKLNKILTAKFFSSEEKGSEELKCKECKKMFKPYHSDDTDGLITGLCPICHVRINQGIPEKESTKKLKVTEEVIKKGSGKKYKISGKPCKYCTGLISWDEYDHTKKTGHAIHVDGDGYKIGDGSCPNWRD